ncbi:MAG: hypothetical protein P4L84_19410 [Isosphaeraceae bacterium]|nr:hypothetical protein [Isosphaeraceae bacterium]
MNQLRLLQPLARPRQPRSVLQPALDPLLADRQGLPRHVARREQPPPPAHHLLVRPASPHVRIEPDQHVQVVIQHCEPTHRNREDLGRFLQPILEGSKGQATCCGERRMDRMSIVVIRGWDQG